MARPCRAATRIAEECLCAPLRLLNRLVSALYDQALASHGLGIAQLNVLVAIEAMGEAASPAAVGRALVLEKSSLSRLVDGVVEQGWVRRRADPSGRGQRLALSAKGRALLERALPDWERAQAQARELLGEREGHGLPALARKLRKLNLERTA